MNQKNVYFTTRCIICGVELADDPGHHSDAAVDLCSDCRFCSDGEPRLFANSIERFLIGNVL